MLDAPPTVVDSTTNGAPNNFTTACGGEIAQSGAVVYEVTLPAEASLIFSVAPSGTADGGAGLDPAVVIRSSACDTENSPPLCAGTSTPEIVKLDAAKGNEWFIVSGQDGTNGDFALTVAATTPKCGDGIVNTGIGEQCDEGTPWPANSGCYPPGSDAGTPCTFVTNDQSCSNPKVVNIPAGANNFLAASGNTTGFVDNYSETCPDNIGLVGAGASDQAFTFIPASTGMMTITMGDDTNGQSFCAESGDQPNEDCWSYVLYARSTCTDSSASALLACAQPEDGAVATITFPVTAMQSYSVIVDGFSNDMYSYGFFNLYVTVQ